MSTEQGSHGRWLARRAVESLQRCLSGPQHPLEHLEDLRHARNAMHDAIGYMVAAAVKEGASFAQVGRALGISRQAAQQAYARRLAEQDRIYQRARIDRDLPPIRITRRIRWPWLRRAS